MNINELRYYIEEIFSIRFINDTNNIRENGDGENFPFPNFVLEFLSNKYIKKPAVDQHALDLLLSVEFFKTKDTIVSLFAKFLNEELDPDDLEFYLYVRSCIEKELNIMFIELARQQSRKATSLNDEEREKSCLSIKSCLNIANNIYGEDQEELLNAFMNKIEEILTEQKNNGVKKNLIESDKILSITLNDYHENKVNNNNIGNNNNFAEGKNKLKNVNMNKLSTYEDIQKNYGEDNIQNKEEKINRLKIILSTYIKEKELDVFFEKLLASYTIYEKSQKKIEEIMAGIKDLVSKKVNLLIKILFDDDEKAWFNSLKLDESDKDAKVYFVSLTGMINDMMQIEKLHDIPENLVEFFGQTLLSTPELNNQINKLIMKRFE